MSTVMFPPGRTACSQCLVPFTDGATICVPCMVREWAEQLHRAGRHPADDDDVHGSLNHDARFAERERLRLEVALLHQQYEERERASLSEVDELERQMTELRAEVGELRRQAGRHRRTESSEDAAPRGPAAETDQDP